MKTVLSILAALVLAANVSVHSQAKKPTIMVVPSESLCIRTGCYTTAVVNGVEKQFPDYRKIFQSDPNIRTLISAMGDFMARNEFPIQSLEQMLRKMEEEDAELMLMTGKYEGGEIEETPLEKLHRVAKADIILDLDYLVERSGPRKQVSFNLQALDAYTQKMISGNAGAGTSANASLTVLLEEAVLSFKDNFLDGLQRYFDDMFANGREIVVTMVRYNTCEADFQTEFVYNDQEAELADIIDAWFADNTVNGRYTMDTRSANRLKFTQVRMPLFGKNLNGKEVGIDAHAFVRPLTRLLKKSPYNLEVGIVPKGLGEVYLTLGDK